MAGESMAGVFVGRRRDVNHRASAARAGHKKAATRRSRLERDESAQDLSATRAMLTTV
ncbi:MAG: hypothetical protein JWM32_1421 [Verrucomicrobia bacterium]|nr:hypothetical protein [Verrucomicrobiota bacterium]